MRPVTASIKDTRQPNKLGTPFLLCVAGKEAGQVPGLVLSADGGAVVYWHSQRHRVP